MKIKNREPRTLDYERLPDPGEDPFDFLRQLKETRSGQMEEFDPASLAGGSARRSISTFDESMMLKEVDIASMVRGVLDENNLVPKDIKIDDGDMPLAKNFYEWVTKDSFAGTVMTPFLEQLIWGIVVFGEWCPACSDNSYLLETHKPDDTFVHFEKKVCLLEHGICPSCKGKKSDFVRSGAMPFYQELAVCAGQRSGKSAATGGLLTPYITHRVLKMQKPNDVYGIAGSTMLHGTFVALTYAQAKETLWEFYYGTLCESKWFCIAEGMPVRMSDGTEKSIENVEVGDVVKTLEGEQSVLKTKYTGHKDCLRVTLENGNEEEGTYDHKVRCLAPDGKSLVWKRNDELTEYDLVVVEN